MHKTGANLNLSAGDLVGHLNCRYLTALDIKVAHGELAKPKVWDPTLEALAERGALHERAYIEHVEAQGTAATVIAGVGVDAVSVAATREALVRGDAVIVQAALQVGIWSGRADVLCRVGKPSELGGWSYRGHGHEVMPGRPRATRSFNCRSIRISCPRCKELEPDSAFVVTPGRILLPRNTASRTMRPTTATCGRSLEWAVAGQSQTVATIPSRSSTARSADGEAIARRRGEPTITCPWSPASARSQIGELERRGVGTTTALAAVPLPLQWRPDRGAAKSYERIREQARIQVEGTQGRESPVRGAAARGRVSVCLAFPSLRPATSSSISRAIRSSGEGGPRVPVRLPLCRRGRR